VHQRTAYPVSRHGKDCAVSIRAGIEKLIRLQNPDRALSLLLMPLTALSLVYRGVMQMRALLYRTNVLRRYRLPCYIIAIGNITVGGTGKTPFAGFLAEHLQSRGCPVSVVTRGYRGKKTAAPLVVSDGHTILATAADAGDEARMLAGKLGAVPVIAAHDRVAACRLAIERFRSRIIILDDGFQYLRLERDLDIVLVHGHTPFGNGFLLPRGTLREPPRALRRADIIVLTKCAAGPAAAALASGIRPLHPGAPVFISRMQPTGLFDPATRVPVPLAAVAGRTVAGLCSIGDPEGFFTLLAGLGCTVVSRLGFPDHHDYQPRDYERINRCARDTDYLVTTEKDTAKLDRRMLQCDTLLALVIVPHIEHAEQFFALVNERIAHGHTVLSERTHDA
jgi:tetraacyldisaccharide 4'-kinase